jgi:hypothetical protein
MNPDFFPTPGVSETLRFFLAIGAIFLMGFSLAQFLKIETKGLLEKFVISICLAYGALHLFAFAVFFSKSDLPIYIFFGICLVSLLVSSKKKIPPTLEKKSNLFPLLSSHKLNSIYFWAYTISVFAILFHLNYLWKTGSLEITKNGEITIFENWDDMQLISFINVARDYFFPTDNPSLPGHLPMYFSWLGNLLPIFLIKFFKLDQIQSYRIWAPIFFQLAIIFQIHYLVKKHTKNIWTPLIVLTLVFFHPFIHFESYPLRSYSGFFLVFSTLIFLVKYLSTKKRTFIALSFLSWSFLYLSKGNYLLVIAPAMVEFGLYVLFNGKFPKLDLKTLKILIFCGLVTFFFFWFSRHYFATTIYYPHYFAGWHQKLSLLKTYLPFLPNLVILAYYLYKNYKNNQPVSILEKFLLISFVGTFLLNLIANRYLTSDSVNLIYIGLIIVSLLIIQKLLDKKNAFYVLTGSLLIIFVSIKINDAYKRESFGYQTTKDELNMIHFLRTQTPKDSVFISNVPRYLDRPAFLSYLSYRKQLIEEGERFANLFSIPLEERIYDYYNFLSCECSKKDQIRFLRKYKNLSHLIVYNRKFVKKGNIIVGMKNKIIVGSKIFKPYPELFYPVYKNDSITVYKIAEPRFIKTIDS